MLKALFPCPLQARAATICRPADACFHLGLRKSLRNLRLGPLPLTRTAQGKSVRVGTFSANYMLLWTFKLVKADTFVPNELVGKPPPIEIESSPEKIKEDARKSSC